MVARRDSCGLRRRIEVSDRVVVTGLGVISPAGVGTEPLETALRHSRSVIRALEEPGDASAPAIGGRVRGLEALDILPRRLARRLDRSALMFASAAQLALEAAGILTPSLDRSAVGVFEGSALAGLGRALDEHRTLLEEGAGHLSVRTLTAAMTGAGGGAVALLHGLRGPALAVSCGSVSSACALGAALDQIRLGEVDVAIAGGSEAPLQPLVLALFRRAGLLASGQGPPERACRPFARDRDGTVLTESGAAVILEALPHAVRRGAPILGELRAVALTNDAASLVAPAADAAERARAMTRVLRKARAGADEVELVAAHGTATAFNDMQETLALKKALGERARRVPVSALKSGLGHALGAASVLELVGTLLAMHGGFVPPTLNLEQPDPECDLDYVPLHSRSARIGLALLNAAGFGGRNASLLIERWTH